MVVTDLADGTLTAYIKEMDQVYGYANRDSGVAWVAQSGLASKPKLHDGDLHLRRIPTSSATWFDEKVHADGMSFTSALLVIWDGESQALFATIMSFWFGARALGNAQQRLVSPERGP